MIVSKELLDKYNAIRNTSDKSLLCHAPFSNINFEQNGNMTACCFNRVNVLGKYPASSIEQAWTGTEASLLRQKIRENNLGGGCNWCGLLLNSENYSGTKSIHFDDYAHKKSTLDLIKENWLGIPFRYFPKVFEFEIDNTCNLECVMCSGYYSSSIRKNQDNLPPLISPYNADFVKEVKKFLPHLTDMKFLGGEPFLIKLYYDIWDDIIAVNPKIGVHITTNGTVLNSRIKDYLEKMNAGIIVSIDSINPDNYPIIRKNGELSKVLDNIKVFGEITKRKGTYLSLAVCPMVNNWRDMPALLQYANDNEYNIHFNVVWKPWELSLRSLSTEDLIEVVSFLESHKFETNNFRQKDNLKKYEELISTITYWQTGEKLHEEEKTRMNVPGSIKKRKKFVLVENAPKGDAKKLARLALQQFKKEDIEEANYLFNEENELLFGIDASIAHKAYSDMLNEMGDEHFVKAYFDALYYLCQCYQNEIDLDEYSAKGSILETVILTSARKGTIIKDMINELSQRKFIDQIDFIDANTGERIKTHIESNYK